MEEADDLKCEVEDCAFPDDDHSHPAEPEVVQAFAT
jgi:hypothetical protein